MVSPRCTCGRPHQGMYPWCSFWCAESISAALKGEYKIARGDGERLSYIHLGQQCSDPTTYSFSISKLQYTLRSFPCFLCPVLATYDENFKSITSLITNMHFSDDDLAWSQVSLPIREVRIGIWRAMQLAQSRPWLLPRATWSSISSTQHLLSLPSPNLEEALLM